MWPAFLFPFFHFGKFRDAVLIGAPEKILALGQILGMDFIGEEVDHVAQLVLIHKNYFSGAQCSACYVDDSALVIEFRFDEKISDLEFQQRFAPDTENIIAEFRPIAQEIADASEITYTGVVLMFLDSEGQRVQSIPIGANNSNMIVDFSD